MDQTSEPGQTDEPGQTSEPGQTDEQVYIPPSGQKYVFRFCKWAQLK